MSDKKMLNEASVRKMMKLANIPSLTDKFIKENYFDYPVEEKMHYQRDEEEPMDEPAMDDAPMEEPEMEMDLDMEEPAGDDLPAAEELVQDLMGVLEKHFDDVDFNVEVEGDDDPMDEPAMDPEPEMDLDEPMDDAPMGDEPPAMDDEEEPMMETDLEEETIEETDLEEGDTEDLAAYNPDTATAEVFADKATGYGGLEEEEEELEEMEDDHAHSKLIDAIAAKVAERLLAEAKKTNK